MTLLVKVCASLFDSCRRASFPVDSVQVQEQDFPMGHRNVVTCITHVIQCAFLFDISYTYRN